MKDQIVKEGNVEGTCKGKHSERAHGSGINVARAKVDQQKVEGHMQS